MNAYDLFSAKVDFHEFAMHVTQDAPRNQQNLTGYLGEEYVRACLRANQQVTFEESPRTNSKYHLRTVSPSGLQMTRKADHMTRGLDALVRFENALIALEVKVGGQDAFANADFLIAALSDLFPDDPVAFVGCAYNRKGKRAQQRGTVHAVDMKGILPYSDLVSTADEIAGMRRPA